MNDTSRKLNEIFYGYIVKKGLSNTIKSTYNVPLFVLEYLLGKYCSTDDQIEIERGLQKVNEILSTNYIRKAEENLIKSRIKELGTQVLIDRIEAELDERRDMYVARISNLNIPGFYISSEFITLYEKILLGGIWAIIKISYQPGHIREMLRSKGINLPKKFTPSVDTPFVLENIQPIQMANIDFQQIIAHKDQFTRDEWMDVIIRSVGYEPEAFTGDSKWHVIQRLVPLVEKNYNFVELGPRSTGKSFSYKELSPHSILLSGGVSTVASLFYNMSRKSIGLVGSWDCVAFDEVAGIQSMDSTIIQMLKDYMTSGSFARGTENLNGEASMVFIGNINESPAKLIQTTHLFTPFPDTFHNDSAFFDRIHYYLPGWEFPKLKSSHFTDDYGFIIDYLAEFLKSSRNHSRSGDLAQYFELNGNVNKRDEIAIHKTVSGLLKILHPDGQQSKEEMEDILKYAIQGRRRVKEQLEKMQGSEYADVDLGYIDITTGQENIIYTPEYTRSTLVSENALTVGHVYGIGMGLSSENVGIFKIENRIIRGEGKFIFEKVYTVYGKECFNAAWALFKDYFKALLPNRSYQVHNYLASFTDTQKTGESSDIAVAALVGLFSAVMNKPIIKSLVVCGNFNLTGTMQKHPPLEDVFRLTKNSGANRILIHQDMLDDYDSVSEYYKSGIRLLIYKNPLEAIKLALELNDGMDL